MKYWVRIQNFGWLPRIELLKCEVVKETPKQWQLKQVDCGFTNHVNKSEGGVYDSLQDAIAEYTRRMTVKTNTYRDWAIENENRMLNRISEVSEP